MDSSKTSQVEEQHYDNPDHPGWCAVCRRAYPCPATLTRAEARRIVIAFRDAW